MPHVQNQEMRDIATYQDRLRWGRTHFGVRLYNASSPVRPSEETATWCACIYSQRYVDWRWSRWRCQVQELHQVRDIQRLSECLTWCVGL